VRPKILSRTIVGYGPSRKVTKRTHYIGNILEWVRGWTMPWKQASPMDERIEMIAPCLAEDCTMTELCNRLPHRFFAPTVPNMPRGMLHRTQTGLRFQSSSRATFSGGFPSELGKSSSGRMTSRLFAGLPCFSAQRRSSSCHSFSSTAATLLEQ
jgi:hypothetical protein